MANRRGLMKMAIGAIGAIGAAGVVMIPATVSAKEFRSDRIIVTVEGKGPDVVLIPGLSSSPRVWQEMIAATPGYRYHKVQVRGFAGHDKGGNVDGPVAAPVSEEVARYIKTKKLKKTAVIGHSMGGTMGMMLAARHPDVVDKLLVVDMLPFIGAMFGGPTATPETLKPIADQIVKSMRDTPAEGYKQQLDATVGGMVNNDALRPLALEDSYKSDRDVSARAYGELVVTDLRPELPAITAKTLVHYVTPKGAPVTDAQMDIFYKVSFAGLKNAEVKRAPDAAHFIMWDNPSWFQAEVKAFLGQ